MADIHLQIPSGASANVPMKKGDNLYIKVTGDCNWCFSDPNSVFSPELLPAGTYYAQNPPVETGPYQAEKTGSVPINAVPPDEVCSPTGGPILTAHSILITS